MRTKFRLLNILILLIGFAFTGCQEKLKNTSWSTQKFNGNWEFILSADSTSIFSTDIDDLQWQSVKLPHSPVIEPLVVNNQWQGICWYRKDFVLPDYTKGKLLFLKFEGAMNVADVWINGIKKITHLGGYLPFAVDFTKEANIGGQNHVIVRLDNRDNPITGPKPLKQLDFNMYGGLYRDAFLIIKNPLFITDAVYANKPGSGGIFISYPEVSEKEAIIKVKTLVMNADSRDKRFYIQHELWKGNEMTVMVKSSEQFLETGDDCEVVVDISLKSPELWSPSSPTLYKLVTVVINDRHVIDTDTTRIGIRHFDIAPNYFAINGKEIFLRGVNRHQEYPYVGYALSNEAQYRDARKIKDAGFDFVRLSHYPHSPAFMDACDELGIVVLDAILGWQYFSEDDAFQSQVLQCCRDLIRRDRNHACVMAWEVSLNESAMSKEFIDKAVAIAHQEYPGDQCFTAGWINYGYDIFLQARQHRLQYYEEPDKPYIVSEYGDWEYYAMNAGFNQERWQDLLQEDRSSRQLLSSGETRLLQQATNIQEAQNDNFTTPAFADGYWVMYDYNRGFANDLEASGIMSINRLPKFGYYFFQSQRDAPEVLSTYTSGPMAFIATYWNEKSDLNVRVFSNCEEVELSLNGEVIARQGLDSNRMSTNLTHPPFTFKIKEFKSGTLTANGYIHGDNVVRHSVSTPGNPVAVRLSYDESGCPPKANVNDILFIYARLEDMNGTVVPVNGVKIDFAITGDAELINPDNTDSEAGIATALVRIGEAHGEISIRAVCKNLLPGNLKIPVVR
ncbi:MAG: DUF4982 domain-containing protein [Bacteroidetes bacterium]|nr:DUF4982 domain-containing protein [Bacteroidota bacterium]